MFLREVQLSTSQRQAVIVLIEKKDKGNLRKNLLNPEVCDRRDENLSMRFSAVCQPWRRLKVMKQQLLTTKVH